MGTEALRIQPGLQYHPSGKPRQPDLAGPPFRSDPQRQHHESRGPRVRDGADPPGPKGFRDRPLTRWSASTTRQCCASPCICSVRKPTRRTSLRRRSSKLTVISANFRFECSFYTWIYRIVTNLCLDLMRRRKTRREDPAVVMDASGEELDLLGMVSDERASANPGRELERKELGAKIATALDKLTPRERMVFELKHYQGLRLRTIGEMLNTTEETAKNTLFRATKKLRASLAVVR